MRIDKINSKEDNEKALAEIKRLWNSKKGTIDGDELNRLGDLVNEWEKLHVSGRW